MKISSSHCCQANSEIIKKKCLLHGFQAGANTLEQRNKGGAVGLYARRFQGSGNLLMRRVPRNIIFDVRLPILLIL